MRNSKKLVLLDYLISMENSRTSIGTVLALLRRARPEGERNLDFWNDRLVSHAINSNFINLAILWYTFLLNFEFQTLFLIDRDRDVYASLLFCILCLGNH